MKLANQYTNFKTILLTIFFAIEILCFTTESENKMKEKINISEGSMKNKKLYNRNFKSIYKAKEQSNEINNHGIKSPTNENEASSYNILDTNKPENASKSDNVINPVISQNDNKKEDDAEQDVQEIDINIGDGPIYATGWIKYFKFDTTSENKRAMQKQAPKTFIVNSQFNEQLKLFPNINLEEKTNDGLNTLYQHIRTKFSFYAILFRNSVNIITSRHVILYFINIFNDY